MRGFESLSDLTGDGQNSFKRNRTALHAIEQRLAGDQFHRQGALAFGFNESVDDGDVGMVQRSQDFRLAIEAGEAVGVAGESAGKNFDGGVARQLCIAPRYTSPIPPAPIGARTS